MTYACILLPLLHTVTITPTHTYIYTLIGQKILGGAADGSIHIWNHKKTFSRPDYILRHPYNNTNTIITNLTIASDNTTLAARCSDGTLFIWDLGPKIGTKPVFELPNVPNDYPTANADFSPDNKYIICGTTPLIREREKEGGKKTIGKDMTSQLAPEKSPDLQHSQESIVSPINPADLSSYLVFYDIQKARKQLNKAQRAISSSSSSSTHTHNTTTFPTTSTSNTTTGSVVKNNMMLNTGGDLSASLPLELQPSLKIAVTKGESAIMVKWAPKTNQIFCRYIHCMLCY